MEANAQAPVNPTTAVATRSSADLATESDIGAISGEISGIRLKYLKPTYGVGGQHDRGFDEGTLVLDGKYVVATKKEPVQAIIVGANLYAKDWLTQAQFSAGQKSKRYPNLKVAAAEGKRIDWTDDPTGAINPATGRVRRIGPEVAEAYDLKVLVRRPSKVTDEKGEEVNADMAFFLMIGEHFYAPALVTFEKMAFKPFVDVLNQCRIMAAQQQKVAVRDAKLHHWLFTLGTTILPAKGNAKSTLIPELKRAMDPVTKRGAVLPDTEIAELEGLMAAIGNADVESESTAAQDDANP